MAHQPLMLTPGLNCPPVLGYCSTHPDLEVACIYTGNETDQKPKKMCRECWHEFKRKVLHLPETKFGR